MTKKSIPQPDEAEIKRYLGIDYGQAKVGLAIADNETKIAFAYTILENDRNLLQKLAEIIKKKCVEVVVIGIPSYVNDEKTVYESERLGNKIKKVIPKIEIIYQNEMFTTKMAQDNLIAKGVKGVKEHDDEEAARIILQGWLDLPHNT